MVTEARNRPFVSIAFVRCLNSQPLGCVLTCSSAGSTSITLRACVALFTVTVLSSEPEVVEVDVDDRTLSVVFRSLVLLERQRHGQQRCNNAEHAGQQGQQQLVHR